MTATLRGRPGTRAVRSRLAHLGIVLALVSLLTFSMVELVPGDAAVHVLGPNSTAEDYARVREQLGLNEPWHERFGGWASDVVTGDLGQSLVPPVESVNSRLARALPVSLELAALALAIALLISVPVALLSARWRGGWFDRLASGVTFGLISVPSFLFGLVVILVVALEWGLLPPGLWVRPTEGGWVDNLRHAALPAFVIAVPEIVAFTRVLRSDLFSTLEADYILAARAKGMTPWHILVWEAFRPSTFSLVTLFGVNFGRLVGGTVVVETLFSLPGMGFTVVDAATKSDFTVVQGALLVVAAAYVAINGGMDLVYRWLDPRIRRG